LKEKVTKKFKENLPTGRQAPSLRGFFLACARLKPMDRYYFFKWTSAMWQSWEPCLLFSQIKNQSICCFTANRGLTFGTDPLLYHIRSAGVRFRTLLLPAFVQILYWQCISKWHSC
jgi:hypothetical protein